MTHGRRALGARRLGSLTRTVRAVRLAATDERIPRPLRWLAALGLAPIPGPFDEALLLAAAVPLAVFYRGPLANAWARAGVRKAPPGGRAAQPRPSPMSRPGGLER